MGLLLLQGATDLNPRELFANGEQGLWLDPSDMTAGKAAWRRNLLTYSEQYSNTVWGKEAVTVTANSTVAPNGTTTADTITEDGTTARHRIYQSFAHTAGVTYTYSVEAKLGTGTRFLIINANTAFAAMAAFNLSLGTVHSTTSGSASITNLGNGWYRCSVVGTATATNTTVTYIQLDNDGVDGTYAGDSSSSLILGGSQIEIGSTPSEYQPITDFATEFKAAYPTHTLYQDSNGVTPCTAAGDPVGLILDQSRGGLSQIGADLVTNGTFAADSDWTKGANWTIGSGVATKTGGAANNLTQTIGSTAAAWYRISLDVTRSAGTLTVSLGTSGTTYAITATGSYTFFILAGSGTQTLTLAGDSSFAGTVDNVVVKNVPGNHAYQTTSASRPTLQTTGGLWYLSFDGSDDSLVTNAVDFSATDEMTVIAGVRRNGTGTGMILEHTADLNSNNGAFYIYTDFIERTLFASRGTTPQSKHSGTITTPYTAVKTLTTDISAPSITGRVNGAVVATDANTQGTGNYANAALYIGRRGGSSLPYNGHIYQLIIRGKTTPTGKLLEAERFVGKKTGLNL